MIDIDTVDFATLLPPLTPDEREQLRDSIAAHGVLDPLVYWRETGLLIDGYHRSAICEELGIDNCPTTRLSFPSKLAAVLFVYQKHLGRRSLSLSAQSQLRDAMKALARQLVAEGGTYRQVGEALGISKSAVGKYVNPVSTRGHPEPGTTNGNVLPAPAPIPDEYWQEREADAELIGNLRGQIARQAEMIRDMEHRLTQTHEGQRALDMYRARPDAASDQIAVLEADLADKSAKLHKLERRQGYRENDPVYLAMHHLGPAVSGEAEVALRWALAMLKADPNAMLDFQFTVQRAELAAVWLADYVRLARQAIDATFTDGGVRLLQPAGGNDGKL
jgi:ParB-like chromosome segregation protein Spo0J